MSTSATRKGRRKLGLLASVVAALGLFLTLSVGNAAATVSCTFDFATGQVQIVVSDDSPPNVLNTNNTITVQRGGSNTIVVNGANCLDPAVFTFATTLNTQQINVSPATNGADGDDTLVVNETAGEFIPGAATPFGGGLEDDFATTTLNEIEWYVNLGLGFNTLTLLKPNGENAITAGSDGGTFGPTTGFNTVWDGRPENGTGAANPTPVAGAPPNYPLCYYGPPIAGDLLVNLNAFPADDDADIYAPVEILDPADPNAACSTTGIGLVIVSLGGGDDFFTGKGGDGTGAPTAVPLVINGGAGNDTCIGGLGPDNISQCEFADGNAPFLADVFGFQDDIVSGWFCATDFFGGVPFFNGDIIDFSSETGPLTIVLNADGSVSVTGVTGTFLNFEGVVGSPGNDTITGNNDDNVLVGFGGDDTIDGLAGDDCIDGDNVNGFVIDPVTLLPVDATGNDNLAGGLDDDIVLGGPGDDTIDENKPVNASGAPTYGPLGNGADAIDGNTGVDTVTYSARTTSIVVYLGLISTFNDGADTNQDGLTNEFDDIFFTTENVITGSGEDLVSANFVNNRANNAFTDNGGNDCLEGGPGNDTFNQGSAPQGADVQIGNTGADTSNYGDRTAAVAVSLDGVANDGDIATNEGDNVGGFSVSCRPQTVVVNPPIGIVIDFFGPDFILNDLNFLDAPVAGPAPNCFAILLLDGVLARAPQGLGFTCDPGEQLGGDQAPLLDVDVENINGGSGNDILVGDSTGNVLNGNGGDDQLSGGASADQLNGGDGNDLLRGGDGNDALNGGAGTNTADYASAGAGGVGVQVNLTTGTGTGEGNDTLKDIANVNGSSFPDSLSGDGNNNVLNGNGGNDAANGNGGDDTVNGGAGADQLKGASGNDKITGAEGNDAMQGGTGNDNIQGGQGKDTALGQKGDDKLYGNAQPDFLNGGPGQDVCKPGSPGLARGDVVVNCES
jgi:Ca2+-binding RTX toxin-like protein